MEPKYEAIIEHNCCAKYVLASINNGETFVIVSMTLGYHKEIVNKYEEKLALENKKLDKILGGGMLSINSTSKKIRTFDMSAHYGPAPQELVEKVLKSTYPDYELEIKTF